MATRGIPMPIPAFAPVLRPPLVSGGDVEEPDTVAEAAMEPIVFVLNPVLTVEAAEIVELDELVAMTLDEMLNWPETATGLVWPS